MISDVISAVEESEKVLLLTHINPDGDAIGSTYAFKKALESLGKTVYAVLPEPLSDYFHMFSDGFITMDEFRDECDLVVALDTGDTNRLGRCAELFKGETVVIDHHETNKGYGKYNHIEGDSPSTGEVLFDLLSYMNVIMTPEIATGLYAAMLTDTGGFIYSNTTAKTHKKAARLIEEGADFYYINKKLMEEKTYESHRVSALLIEKMEFFCDGKLCVCVFDNDFCVKNNISLETISGLSALPRTVSGVDTGILISEVIKGKTKVSLRTDMIVDAAKISVSFGGGGHKRAAGFTTEEATPSEIKEKLVEMIKPELEG